MYFLFTCVTVWANPFRGPLEGLGTENRDFFGPCNGNERSECRFKHGDIALLSGVLRKKVASLTVSCLVTGSILGPAPMKGQTHL